MVKFQKVVWHEGMKLDPHHFQQLDRYFQYNINKRIGTISSTGWGFSELQIDTAALANGNFNLVDCRGVMPDGLYFNIPENEAPVKARKFDDLFDATSDKLDVFLALPNEQVTGNNCQLDNNSENRITRYTMHTIELLDDNVGSNIRQVGVARPNFSIKFEDENFEEFGVLKIGEIVKASDGTFSMNKNFIPPILVSSVSEGMMFCLREILGGLVAKSKELKNQLNPNKREIAIADVEVMMLLQTINTYIPIINQYYNTPHYHPENIYSLLLCLGGQLSTLMTGAGITAVDFKPYDHKNLNEVFHHLFNQLMALLNIKKQISKPDISIPLEKQSDSLYMANLSEQQIESQLFIVVKGNLSEEKIISDFAKNIKIAAHEEIFAVHQAGLQGVTIDYISRPPSGLSVDPEYHYFKIHKDGRLWDKIVEKQTIAFFLAMDFTQMDIQLISFMPK